MIPKRLSYVGTQLLFAVAFVLLWEWGSSSGVLDTFYFGKPSEMWVILKHWIQDGTLAPNLWSTTRLVVVGFLAGLGLGTAIGCLLAFSRFFRDVVEPGLIFLNAMPRIILYPFLIVWLGFGITPKLVTITLVMLPTVAISVAAGFKDVEADYLANVRAMGASRLDIAKDVYVPSLAVWLLATSRVTFGFAFQAAIVAEILGSRSGLGFLILKGQTSFNVNMMYASITVLLLLALVIDALLSAVERRATRWMPDR